MHDQPNGDAVALQDTSLEERMISLESEAEYECIRTYYLEKRLNDTIEVLNAIVADITKAVERVR